MKHISILGAGLSGLTAGINLAKAGYSVDIYEKRAECGARFSGDLEGLENWAHPTQMEDEFHRLNLCINFDCDPFHQMFISNGTDRLDVTSSTYPIFYLVKRGILPVSIDQGLKKQALKAGATIHFNTTTPIDTIDIIATGPTATKPIAKAKGITFQTTHENIAVALVGNTTSYKGYGYLLVSKGYGCICTVCFHNSYNITDYFTRTIEVLQKQYNLQIKNEKPVGGIGTFFYPWRLEEHGTLYAGEAAGLQDFLWGFGMRYALTSGYLAAQSIIQNKSYPRLIHKHIYPKLKASLVNRFYVMKLDDYGTALFRQGKKLSPQEKVDLMQRMYNYSFRKRLVYPFARQYLKKSIEK